MRNVRHMALVVLFFLLVFGPAVASEGAELVRASKLQNRMVHLDGGETAELDGMLFDPKTGLVGFARVTKGGLFGVMDEDYVIPWQALDMQPNGEFSLKEGVVPREMPDIMSLEQTKVLYMGANMKNPVAKAREEVASRECPALWDCDRLYELERVLYSWIRSGNREIGLVNDVLLDPATGQVALLVMERGAYFFRWVEVAMEEEQILLPWPSVKPMEDRDMLLLEVEPDTLTGIAVLPAKAKGGVDLDRAAKIYKHFGYDAFWKAIGMSLE